MKIWKCLDFTWRTHREPYLFVCLFMAYWSF